MNLENRENFLNKLANKMGRARQLEPTSMEEPLNDYPLTRLTHLSQSELCDEFINFAKVLLVDIVETKEENVAKAIIDVCEKYGGGSIVLNHDSRLEKLGIINAVKNTFDSYVWDHDNGDENIIKSAKANIGIVHGEYGLAESGGVVLFSSKENGRSTSLLPEKSIVVIRKSTVLPRVAQLAQILHEKALIGERIPSCINIISGPSATADIELIKVVGVHGPVSQIYVVIDDLN
ncbi:LutC/YkgG family protein [Rodentibacter pneumotropicus]|uniref:Protein YkgG n=1 Tax=Rodentibacter pneumotropicus TaxID=758 RepID=A0A448MRW9_9PAST|nr:lactate utilization protein C [Rodentibacter pneumotropicus]NBH75965.1 lactate utilization protein C [Rodentibacter pneumotropicus]THA08153.1 lactate utilization protein C [Rodentibacter pneumotropicus]THA10015.1 lactate utilization protein C [Rodentibacter pneumotropicus]THA15588.1 lactate utilization protein C [Rodentibacter pneumotropicus]VEH67887.1 protein YkgG [Rodentibacter pneumotropicus]